MQLKIAMVLEAFASDPRLTGIVADYQARQQEPGKRFGSNGLKVNGKLFALFAAIGLSRGDALRADEIVPAIQGPRLLVVVRIDRPIEAITNRIDTVGADSKANQVLLR